MPRSPRDTGRRRRSGAPLRLYLTFLAGWVLASVLIVRGTMAARSGGHDGATSAWFFVAGTGVLVAALIDRDIHSRRRTDALLRDRQAVIESIGVVTDPRLTQLPLYQLLDELLARVRTVLQADTASVFLYDRERSVLRRSAHAGARGDAGAAPEVRLREGVIGQVAANRRGVILLDAPAERSTMKGTASLMAAPLVAEGQLVGVLQLGTQHRRHFDDEDLRLLQLVADRAAVAIDASRLEEEARRATLAAEGARRRLSLLADAGEVLAASFERVATMAEELAAAIVPTYADWCAFHQIAEDGRPRMLAWQAGPAVAADDSAGDGWDDVVAGVVRTGEPALVWGDDLAGGDAYRAARRLGLTSVVVAPVRVRSLALGTVTFGTAGGRRGLRVSDVETIEDLAARIAVAVERVLLSAETERSALRTARHAAQLQRLTEGASAINAALATPALVDVVAEQAARVLDADAVTVDLADGEPDRPLGRAQRGVAAEDAHRARAVLTDPTGAVTGSVSVARSKVPFSPEEEAILGSLAQMASVASANARLYESAQYSEARMRALYDASPVGIVELDGDGEPVRWNRAAEAVFGWSPYDEAATPAVVPDPARELVASVLAGDAAAGRDAVLGDTSLELVAVPLGERDGGARGAVLAAVDVTERQQVAEQLRQAQRMEAMATMAGGIAHDFNNVLMVIGGYADLLLRRPVDDDVRSDVTAMRDAAERAAEMTRKLLTISRRQLVQPQVVDVGQTLESLRAVLDVMVGSAVTLTVDVDDPPLVLVDPSQFEQVVLNLAINGRDAMPEGGTLTIRSFRGDDGWSVLEIGDTGEGMDAATLEHCFEPFFTTKDRAKGTGLGLSTVYGVVTQAGGEITVDSRPGRGTSFTVRLAPAEPAGTPDELEEAAARLRILVVDDEPDVRAVVADLLELEGHDVAVAADGDAALAAADADPPDVLVTDVVMPGLRGPDLARRIVARHPAVRVVLMSSHVDDDLALDGDVDGATFLAKPFTGVLLLNAIATAAAGGDAAQGSKR